MSSLKERLAAKRDKIKSGGGSFKYFIIKEGTQRFRLLPVGDEKDWSIEATTFFLSKELGLVVSPATFGKKCALKEAYDELSNSKNPDERELAKRLKPGRKFFAVAGKYKDEKGKEPEDKDNGVKLLIMTPGVVQDLIELYLDEEFGDFTDKNEGYDIKFKRSGKGKNDTEYQVVNCNKTKMPSIWKGTYDPEAMLKTIIPTYEETKVLRDKFLAIPPEEEAEEAPRKKKKSSNDEPVKKKKKKSQSKDL